jgi:hypothetical protein
LGGGGRALASSKGCKAPGTQIKLSLSPLLLLLLLLFWLPLSLLSLLPLALP